MNPTRQSLVAAGLAALLLLGAVLAAFAPALDAGFVVLDDDQAIVLNEDFRGLDAETVEWAFTTRHMGHWQPLAWLSFALDHARGGLEPRGYHETNVLLHAANALLVLLLSARVLALARPPLAQAPWRLWGAALVAAAAFALHPLRVESVAWVTERRDLLAASFLLLALLAWLECVEPGTGKLRSRAAWFASVALLAVSLLAKAWGMTFWVVLLALDQALLARGMGWRARLIEKAPHIVLGFAAAAVASWAIRSAPGVTLGLDEWSLAQRAGQAVQALAWYAARTLDGQGLCAMHELPHAWDPFEARTASCAMIVAALAATCFVLRRRLPLLGLALFVHLVLVSPVLGLQQAGPQFVADRYAYLASIPLGLLVAGLLSTRGPLVSLAASCLLASLMVPATRAQCRHWRDDESLWARVLEVHPGSSIGWQGRGNWLLARNRPAEALEAFQRAVASNPRNWRAHSGVGDALDRLDPTGRSEEAVAAWTRALEGYFPPWTVRVNLANHLISRRRDLAGGLAQYEAAVREMEARDPYWTAPLVWYGAGQALRAAGREAEGRALLQKAAGDARTRDLAAQALRSPPPRL